MALLRPQRACLPRASPAYRCRRLLLRPPPTALAPRRRYASGPAAAGGANDYQFGPSNDMQPQPSSQHLGPAEEEDGGGGAGEENEKRGKTRRGGGTWWKMFESSATTAASLGVLAAAGFAYHRYYKLLVLSKIKNAFTAGDPALNLARGIPTPPQKEEPWVVMEHQEKIDDIVAGREDGHYYLLIGEKGTGKTSMLLSAMAKTDGDGCSVMEAHADPEIFRVRLGKALDFEFHEDYIGSLFSIRGPRETTALLDIERAFNKLEKVALEHRASEKKPLVMIFNGMHMIRDDQEGRDLVELLQQRAEAWAAAGLVTCVFNSDDYWVYERMKQYGSRMELISIRDLPQERAFSALRNMRRNYYKQTPDDETLAQVYAQVGGRLAYLSRVAKSPDMLAKCAEINRIERQWLLNQCGLLGPDMDDDVMDQQKFASSAMLLVQKLVAMEREVEAAELERLRAAEAEAEAAVAEELAAARRKLAGTDPVLAAELAAEEEARAKAHKGSWAFWYSGSANTPPPPSPPSSKPVVHPSPPATEQRLPELPLHEARKVMTRADFIQAYDHYNIFTIDSHGLVRADSVPMMNAFRHVASEPDFDELLEDTLERIGDIESLGRTREITLKDLWNGGRLVVEEDKRQDYVRQTLKVKRGPKGVHGDGDVKLPKD